MEWTTEGIGTSSTFPSNATLLTITANKSVPVIHLSNPPLQSNPPNKNLHTPTPTPSLNHIPTSPITTTTTTTIFPSSPHPLVRPNPCPSPNPLLTINNNILTPNFHSPPTLSLDFPFPLGRIPHFNRARRGVDAVRAAQTRRFEFGWDVLVAAVDFCEVDLGQAAVGGCFEGVGWYRGGW